MAKTEDLLPLSKTTFQRLLSKTEDLLLLSGIFNFCVAAKGIQMPKRDIKEK